MRKILTISYNGAGLGDLLNQLTFIRSYAIANDFQFIIPKLYCSRHGVDYGSELGLINCDFYKSNLDFSDGKNSIASSNLSDISLSCEINPIRWDYKFGDHYRNYGVSRIEFPFLDFYPNKRVLSDQKIAVIHLRMGDARSYQTRFGLFDVEKLQLGMNSRYQWTVNDLSACVKILKNQGYVVKGFTDGTYSAEKRIRWSNSSSLAFDKNKLIDDVISSGAGDISIVKSLFDDFVIESESISTSLQMIVNSDLVVSTSGTFANAIFNGFNLSRYSRLCNMREIISV